MNTTHRVVNTLTILHVSGVLAADPDTAELDTFRSAVEEAAAEAVDLAIDVSEVPSIDSEGVGELARALGRVSRRGGRLALIAPSPSVKKILTVTKLDGVFNVLASEEAAIDLLVHGKRPHVSRSFAPN